MPSFPTESFVEFLLVFFCVLVALVVFLEFFVPDLVDLLVCFCDFIFVDGVPVRAPRGPFVFTGFVLLLVLFLFLLLSSSRTKSIIVCRVSESLDVSVKATSVFLVISSFKES